MIIVGLDPGSWCTGYGVLAAESGELRCLLSGCIRPPRGAGLAARLYALHQGLHALLAEVAADAVAMEECFIGCHARPALVLGHARGALIVAALARNVPVHEYAPRLVKLSVTGAGGASKEQVRAMVCRLAAGTRADAGYDETDALAVAICHAHRAERRVPLIAR